MRIAYVFDWVDSRGVQMKIATHLRHWGAAGVDVELLSVAPEHASASALDADLFRFRSLVGRARATKRLADRVRTLSPDLVYLRYDLFFPTLASGLRGIPIVLELNTDRKEYALRSPLIGAYESFNRRLLFRHADGFACVTRELAETVGRSAPGKPVAVVSNGLAFDEVSPLPPSSSSQPRLAFFGHPGAVWHGLDKVLRLAAAIPDFEFAIIGVAPTDIAAPPNVHLHGVLERSEYRRVLADCDVGLGTLALHRKGMEEAAPLKVREYLAYGLPTVIAYRDVDFVGERPWFLLQLSNTETNIVDEVGRIRRFVQDVRGRRVQRSEVTHLDARVKEEARLRFLREVLAGAR